VNNVQADVSAYKQSQFSGCCLLTYTHNILFRYCNNKECSSGLLKAGLPLSSHDQIPWLFQTF